MNNGVSGTESREAKMREIVNGKSFREVEIRGWQARHARLRNELADMSQRLAEHSKLKPNGNSPDAITYLRNLVQNEKDLVAQLQRDSDAAEAQLASWGASPTAGAAAVP